MGAVRRGRARWLGIGIAAVALAAAAVGLFALRRQEEQPPTADSLVAEARRALERGEFGVAEQLANRALEQEKDSVPALFIAGQSAAKLQRFETAVAYLDRIPDASGTEGAAGLLLAGNILLDELHRASLAELRFRRAWQNDPQLISAVKRLANLLAVEGRTSEAIPLILELFRRGEVNIDELALLDMLLGTINDAKLLRECHLADRADPAILLGLAASVTFNLKPEQAKLLLSEAVQSAPQLSDGQARLGRILLHEGDAAAFLAWHRALPVRAEEHPEIWAIRGAWAQKQGETRVAMRCYWETLRRDPNHRAAQYQLGQLLLRDGDERSAAPLIARGQQLQELRQLKDVLLHESHTTLEPMRLVAEKLLELGRVWEAWGWCEVALRQNPTEAWAIRLKQQVAPTLATNPPLTLPTASPVASLDLGSLPVPTWRLNGTVAGDKPARASGAISFVENAEQLGLRFQYFADSRPAAEGKRMYEFPGGGVAILDYDLDGWPDLYLTQGCRWPPDATQRKHLDRLFRNLEGQRFHDVTESAEVIEPGFSHGATVGDFNSDGFPDVYVANIGHNRLYRNNGDGTFADASAGIEGDAGRWTTSCLLADVNGDGFPDLYDVNYVGADDVFERVCKHADGMPRMCMPFHFLGAQDQLYVNSGDGRFAEVTAASGIEVQDGKGLGIVAADFTGSGRLSLFIANDTTPNSFFVNQTTQAGESPRFLERGVEVGLAFDADGRAEGCMGVAAGDLNQDGLLDLFVGNFLNESNTLYLQQAEGLFVDATSAFHLDTPSLDLLAFGTQFLDADLDGDLDLIVTNGHVDDVRAYGRPYQMRPQFFENPGSGPLIELTADSLGDFFRGEYLGRSLALCDWNRDGLEDIAISHLDSHVALLTNRAKSRGHVLVLHLRGVESSRDAIGATATIRLGDRRLVRQLTAGDGYQCSNQRVLTFGLGADTTVAELEIRWPSGQMMKFPRLAADREILIVEGDSSLRTLREL